MNWIVAASFLLQLTGPDGQVIYLDSDKVTTLRVPRSDQIVAASTRCHVFTVDGKNINVRETCDQVREMLQRR